MTKTLEILIYGLFSSYNFTDAASESVGFQIREEYRNRIFYFCSLGGLFFRGSALFS